jgi:hypothetical protein
MTMKKSLCDNRRKERRKRNKSIRQCLRAQTVLIHDLYLHGEQMTDLSIPGRQTFGRWFLSVPVSGYKKTRTKRLKCILRRDMRDDKYQHF